jgi:manganese/iron transport system permease protein
LAKQPATSIAIGIDFWWLLEPLGYGFMLRGLAAAVIVGAVSAVVGTFVVVRGMAFFGDALAHAILPGIAIGYLVGGRDANALFVGGLIAAIIASLAIGAITEGGKLKEDTAIGIIFAGMFALGIAMISRQPSYAVDLSHILFGNVLAVSTGQLLLLGGLGIGVVAVIFLLYKEFVLISFDPIEAQTLRLPARRLHYLLLTLIAITIVASLQTVGVALMVAMLITPPATAFLLTHRLTFMMGLGALIGAGSGVVGLYSSYYLGIASGAAVVLVATIVFVVTLVLAPQRAKFWHARERAVEEHGPTARP